MTTVSNDIIHLLPGPVELDKRVMDAFFKLPVSHRSEEFISDFDQLRKALCHLVNSKHAEILAGSGTLANDAIAAQLSLNDEHGLILTNGEFGDRLISQAKRFKLKFLTFSAIWGEPFSYREFSDFIDQNSQIKWIWAVHCETSTGVMNDIDLLQEICNQQKIKLCLDCISSVGTIRVNLKNIYLVSCSSGKALCSYPGLSMVFSNHEILLSGAIPKYLDIGYYRSKNGIPFTISTNLVYALFGAVKTLNERTYLYDDLLKKSKILRDGIRQANFKIINGESTSSPAVITIELPADLNSVAFGNYLAEMNCIISFNSNYLIKRNWIQTFITRNTTMNQIDRFITLLHGMFDKW